MGNQNRTDREWDELRRSEERFRKIFDHSNDAIFVVDPRRDEILDANSRACEMLGYTRDELLASPVSAMHPDANSRFLAFTEDVYQQGSGWTDELTCLTKSGETLPAEISASVIEMDGRRCMLAMVRNITKRKRAENALQENEKRSEQELHRQLKLAAKVHRSLIPQQLSHEKIDVDVRYIPIDQVGGDYCQVRFADRDTCYITMCDVTGHGIGASALAARVSSEVRHFILDRLRPSDIVKSLNTFILEHFQNTELFLTFIAARIDLKSLTLTYSGAGHPGPLLVHRDRDVDLLASQNPLVGVFDEVLSDNPEQSLQLEAGDRLLLYTDGIIETTDATGRELGAAGLARIGVEAMGVGLFEMADQILAQVDQRRHGPVKDDKTLIVAEIK